MKKANFWQTFFSAILENNKLDNEDSGLTFASQSIITSATAQTIAIRLKLKG